MTTSTKHRSQRRTRRALPTGPAPQAAFHPHPTHDDIAARAYELFVRRGGRHGQDWEDWLLAERELAASGSRQRLSGDQPDYAG
jgi:hypothetical protein